MVLNLLNSVHAFKQETSIELLPEVEQQLVKSGRLPVIAVTSDEEAGMPPKSDLRQLQESKSSSLLAPTSADSSLFLQTNSWTPAKSSVLETPSRLGGIVSSPDLKVGNYGSSILHKRLFANAEGPMHEFGVSRDFKFDDISASGIHRHSFMNTTPLKDRNNSSITLPNSNQRDKVSDKISPEPEENGFISQSQNSISRYSHRKTTNSIATPGSNRGLLKDLAGDARSNLSSKRVHSDRDDGLWNSVSSEDPMDVSWR